MKVSLIIFLILPLTFVRLEMLVTEQPKLIFVQQVFRHGHRQPMYPSHLDGSDFVNEIKSYGQLTKQGKSMQYILGQNLYKFYWYQLFAGTPYYNTYNQSKFYVKSTNTNRSLDSVYSQLLGVFENLNKLTLNERDIPFSLPAWPNATRKAGDVFVKSPFYQPVPVHEEKCQTTTDKNGNTMRMYASLCCPNQNKWRAQNLLNPHVVKIINDPSFQRAIKTVSSVLKLNLTFWDIYKYYTNAICMHYQGRKVNPIWIEPSETQTALRFMKTLQIYMKFFYKQKQKAAISTGYFNDTYNHFKRVTQDQSGVQWAFYSGHDASIAAFINRLNMTSVECIYQSYLKGITKDSQSDSCIVEYPEFASTLIFEVYRYANESFTFKIRYNGLLRKIPFCDYKLQCSVERYYQWFESWKVKDIAKECGIVDKEKKKAKAYQHALEVNIKQSLDIKKQLHYYKQQNKKLKKQLQEYQKMEKQFNVAKEKLDKVKLILSHHQEGNKDHKQQGELKDIHL